MEIQIDDERCIATGRCALIAPDVFYRPDDDGVVELLDPAPAPPRWGSSREAAAHCPASAIAIRED
jgi:ferredoxin